MIYKNRRTSGKLKLIILLIAGGLLGAGSSFFFIGRAKADNDKKHEQKAVDDEETTDEGEESEDAIKPEHITYIGLGAFLVNLDAETGMHYLRVEISVGVELPEEKKKGGHGGGSKAPVLPPADDAIARDAIVRTLSAQSFDELKTQGPGDALKEKLVTALSESLQECKIHAVMFTSFVLQ